MTQGKRSALLIAAGGGGGFDRPIGALEPLLSE